MASFVHDNHQEVESFYTNKLNVLLFYKLQPLSTSLHDEIHANLNAFQIVRRKPTVIFHGSAQTTPGSCKICLHVFQSSVDFKDLVFINVTW
jgi:hypothetical protein